MPRRRAIFLIDRRFQLRFSLYVCSWLFALSLVYPLVTVSLFDFFNKFAKIHAPESTYGFLQEVRSEFLGQLSLLEVSWVAVTFLISLFMSHKIAGPLYKLRKAFEKAKNGDLKGTLSFRKSDHFQDVANDYNDMMDQVRAKFDQNIETVSTCIARIEAAAAHVQPEGKKELEQALDDLRKAREQLSY